MVLLSGINDKTNEAYRVYLETYPYKVYDSDFNIILDSAYDKMLDWISSMKRLQNTDYKNDLIAFSKGEDFFITCKDGTEYKFNRDMLAIGIGKALKTFQNEMIDFNDRLKSQCMSSELCDFIVQMSLLRTNKKK